MSAGALGRELHPTAYPNRWMRFLHRLRIDLGIFELDKFTFVGSKLLRPDRLHGLDGFVGGVAGTVIGHAEHAKFVRLTGGFGTEANSHQQTPVSEMIQC